MIQLEPNVKNEEVKTTGRPKTKEEMLQEQCTLSVLPMT